MEVAVERDVGKILVENLEEMNMQNYKTVLKDFTNGKFQVFGAALLLTVVWASGCSGNRVAKAAASDPQTTFATPAEAGQALVTAARANDEAALARILGPSLLPIFDSGDPTSNKQDRDRFVAQYSQMNRWVSMTDGTQVLNIGADNYPFPVPLDRDADARWQFNSEAGEHEILVRRIGENELLAIDACVAIDNAERLYARKARGEGTTPQYTSRIISSPGKQDGLYWQVAEGHKSSPLGRVETFAPGAIVSAGLGESVVFDGYTYRILTAQGLDAEGGAMTYLVDGKLTGGFAILASPVKYGKTGTMTFLLGPEGFFEQDLGNSTSQYAATTKEFNPNEDWTAVE